MWAIFALTASMFWGLSYVFFGEVYKKISVLTALGITSFFVCIASISVAYYTGKFKPDVVELLSSKQIMWYMAGAITSFFIAEFFIGSSIAAKNATLAGLIEISYPLFIAVFSYIIFRNQVSLATILGGIVIFIGIFIIYKYNI